MKRQRRHYTMIKGINIRRGGTQYKAPKYMKQILTDIKGEIDNHTITIGDCDTY